MWIDLLALALLAVSAVWGARLGALESSVRFVGLFAAYFVAAFAGLALGGPAAERVGLPSLVGVVGIASAALVLTQIIVSLLARQLRADEDASGANRFFGGVFGLARGGVLVLPLLWVVHLGGGLAEARPDLDLSAIAGARLPAVSGKVLAGGAGLVLEDAPSGRVATQFVADPAATAARFEEVVAHPRLVELQQDGGFWLAVEQGEVAGALGRPSFVSAAHDATLRGELAALGLVSEQAGSDPRRFRSEMMEVLDEVGPRLRRVRQDPALEGLLNDETFRASLEQGDAMALLSHPEFRALLARVGDAS